jgi:hypothetical protein
MGGGSPTFAPMTSCAKCSDPAQVALSFDYAASQVWLRDLANRFDRYTQIPLCEMHADRISPPSGWTLLDDRAVAPPLFLAVGVA